MATLPSPNDLTRQQLDELDALLQRMLSLPLNKPEDAPPFAPPPLPEMPAVPPRPAAGWRADGHSLPRPPYQTATATPEPAPVSAWAERGVARPESAISPSFTPFASDAVVTSGRVRTPSVPARTTPADHSRTISGTAEAPRTVEALVDPSFNSFGSKIVPQQTTSAKTTPFAPVNTPATAPEAASISGTLRGVDAPATPAGFRSAFADMPAATEPFPSLPALFHRKSLSETTTQNTPATAPQVESGRTVPLALLPIWVCNFLLEWGLGWFGPLGAAMTHPAGKTLLGSSGIVMLVGAACWTAKGLGWLSWTR